MFKIEGTFNGRPAEVIWDGGKLRGFNRVISAAEQLVEQGAPIPITPTGPEITASLSTPEDAVVTLGSLFQPGYALSGDEPLPEYPLSDLPEDAVA